MKPGLTPVPAVQLATPVGVAYGAAAIDGQVVTKKLGPAPVPAVHVVGSTTVGPLVVATVHVMVRYPLPAKGDCAAHTAGSLGAEVVGWLHVVVV